MRAYLVCHSPLNFDYVLLYPLFYFVRADRVLSTGCIYPINFQLIVQQNQLVGVQLV